MKGQGLIAQVIMFSVTVFLSIAILLLVTSEADESVKSEVALEGEIGGSVETIEDKTVLTYILNQEVNHWVESNNQYNITALELTQHYFSADKIKINDTEYDRDVIKNDLEAYFNHDYSFSPQEYKIANEERRGIVNITSEHHNEYIEARQGLENLDRHNWNRYERKVPISQGEITFTYWVGRAQ